MAACRAEVWPATPTTTDAPTPSATPSSTGTPSSTATLSGSPTLTSTPRPTNTPRPARIIRKIGPEIYGGTRAPLGKPPVIKLRNVSREYVAEVRQLAGPDCLIVIRFEHDQPDAASDPRQAARDWHGRRRQEMLAMRDGAAPNIAFETAVNECPEQILDWYVQFSLELIPLMHADGLRCVAGNPGVGEWTEEGWARFRPVIAILRRDDFVGVHEYWVDTPDIGNRWHCARWTIPGIAAVLGNARIVVTECGRDVVEGRGLPGWRRTCNTEDFLWDLEEYDAVLRQFPNVVGATVFTLDPNWADFDATSLWPQVVYRYSLTPTPAPVAGG
ncbi:MAG: hypothetical protein QME94_07160 [Anaerolineae bacterium]|nr:hypothetical protein [Anaerolineae bacterium]